MESPPPLMHARHVPLPRHGAGSSLYGGACRACTRGGVQTTGHHQHEGAAGPVPIPSAEGHLPFVWESTEEGKVPNAQPEVPPGKF